MSDLSFQELYGDSRFEFICHECGGLVEAQIKQIGTAVQCDRCSAWIRLGESEEFQKSMEEARRIFESL